MKKAVLKEAAKTGMRNKIWILATTANRRFRYPNFRNNHSEKIGSHLFLVFPTAGGRDNKFQEHFLNVNYSDVKHKPWIKNFLELKHRNGSNNTTLTKWGKKFELSLVSFVHNAIDAYKKYWLGKLQNYSNESSLKKISFTGLNNESMELDEKRVIKDYFCKV